MLAEPMQEQGVIRAEMAYALQMAGMSVKRTLLLFDDRDAYGWVTACNARKGLMLGYVWKLSEYPWMLIYRMPMEGNPRFLTFEPATGFPGPYEQYVTRGRVLGRPLFEFLDAGKTVEKSYTAFLSEISADYRGVETVQVVEGGIVISEQGSDRTRDIRLKMK